MNNRTFYITEEQQKWILNESATDRFIDNIILKNLPERAKGLINTPLNVIVKENPEVLNGVALNENPEVMQKYGDLPLKDFIRVTIMQSFDIRRGSGPKKYLRGIFRIMLDEIKCLRNPDQNAVNQLKDDVMYIMQASENSSDQEAENMDGNLNGWSLSKINQTFREKRKAFFANIRNRLSSTFKGKSNAPRYEKVVITDQKQCTKYAPYTKWCITWSPANYDTYTQGGRRFYLFLREGYQNVRCEVGENCPFDDYGMSMVSVLVDTEGNISIITTRWNHDHDGEMAPPSQEQIEKVMNLMGVNLYRECPPYTKEELKSMGITPFEDVPELLAQGVDPKDIFDWVGDFSEGFAVVKLNNKCNYLTSEGRLLSPNQWFDYVGDFSEGFAVVKLNGKCNYLTSEGRLLSPNQWFDWVGDFSEGFAVVKLNRGIYYLRKDGVLCDYHTEQPIPELNESKSTKHTFNITETRLNMFLENMLTESFIIPKHEQVRVVREYLDKNFLRSESDDIDENGYPCKVKSVTLVSSNGQALKPMTIAELFMMLDDKFNRIIRDKDKRQAFLKQVITDWYYKRISKEGILSSNVIQIGGKKK